MPQVPCPSCGSVLKIGDTLAGARVRCPSCKNVFQAPGARAKPRPVAAAPAPADFDFGAPASSSAPPNAFDNLESDDPGIMLGRRRLHIVAASMSRAVAMLVAIPCITGVIAILSLGFRGAPLGLLAVYLAAYFVIVAAFLALPVTFMTLGASALQRTSSLGLAVTGAVFAVLMGGLLALAALAAAASVLGGNLGGIVAAPLLGVAAYFCITAAVQTFQVSGDPEVREAFAQAREQRQDARERRRS